MSMHPSQEQILKYFEYEHLPTHLQEVSKHFHWLAWALVGKAPLGENSTHQQIIFLGGPELTVALRKLLEAKDCAVRAALDGHSFVGR